MNRKYDDEFKRQALKKVFDGQSVELQAKGYPITQIASSLRMHRRTVRVYLKSDDLPERKKPMRFAELRKYLSYLEQRWAEGERNASSLGRELKEKGYRGKISTVVHHLVAWRKACPDRNETFEMVKGGVRFFVL